MRERLSRAFVISWPKALRTTIVLVAAWTLGLSAQQPPGSKTGNPTPGTPQPDPPNLADRITVTGCVQAVPQPGGRAAAPIDSNSPSDARFVLVKAARSSVVPPDTGTSAVAATAASDRYRLSALDSQLSPFVGTRVEISGEISPSTSASGDKDGTPVLQVEFVQKLSPTCP
ncbi:MAG: hypothetical protein ABJA98_30110 [Acidobacteriota bacterium]